MIENTYYLLLYILFSYNRDKMYSFLFIFTRVRSLALKITRATTVSIGFIRIVSVKFGCFAIDTAYVVFICIEILLFDSKQVRTNIALADTLIISLLIYSLYVYWTWHFNLYGRSETNDSFDRINTSSWPDLVDRTMRIETTPSIGSRPSPLRTLFFHFSCIC